MTKKNIELYPIFIFRPNKYSKCKLFEKNRPIIVTIFYKQEFIHKIYRFSKKSKIA